MIKKGFEANMISEETPKSSQSAEKPLNKLKIETKRVDINVLKSKLQETESKELKKNIYILSSLVAGLGALGVYLSF